MAKKEDGVTRDAAWFAKRRLKDKVVINLMCRFVTPSVGGVPAKEADLKNYVKYHLGLEGEEAEASYQRISGTEIGTHSPDMAEGDEITEKETYGVNVYRRDENGPYLGAWMFKACMKQTASRLGLFMKHRGLKGDMAEMTSVSPLGKSHKGDRKAVSFDPLRVYLFNPDRGKLVHTTFEKFVGTVNNRGTRMSIMHDSEVVPAGTMFSVQVVTPSRHLSQDSIDMILSDIGNVGLGSAKALERGKFEIIEAEILPGSSVKIPA